MAEVVVSPILELLASVLLQQVKEKVRLVKGVDEEVQKMASNFQAIESLLEDAECKRVKEKAVGDWLDKLKEVSYDIEDVLDEWNTAIQKLQIAEAESASKLVMKVCSFISCYGFCGRHLVVRHDIAKKIKILNKTLDDIFERKNRFNLSSSEGRGEVERQITTSGVDPTEIHGRDDDKNKLTHLLLSESSDGTTSPPIVSIVGMGGIGKTTLARLAFNDRDVSVHFEVKIWVCVSDPFDEIRIAKAVLESLTKAAPIVSQYENLLENIRQSISDKKFLLVLDDVWTRDSSKWEQLKNTLKCGSKGSRILVTTRKMNVARVIGSTNFIELGILSDEKSWSLFTQVAFNGRNKDECKKLEDIGRRIVGKCKGLPLAVKSLGSLLRFKNATEEWESVLDSEMWELEEELEEEEKRIFSPLLLSYFDLPFELKRCFLYCAIFPKDYIINKDQLIKLWMAQDYLRTKRNKEVKLIGAEYFEKLATRSFFQDFERSSDDGSIICCKMHDMVHDLAQYLTKNECFSVEVDGPEGFVLNSSDRKARHLMIVLKRNASVPISIFHENRLRSLVFDCDQLRRDHIDIDISNLFNHLTCVRALSFRHMSIREVPSGINKLIHLRHLDISKNLDIEELPEALSELYNLRVLDVNNCLNLKKLPEGIGKLVNLSHLINYDSFWSCIYMPKGIERLTCLRTLSKVVVSGGKKECKFECLRNLNNLQGSLDMKCAGLNVGEINNAEMKKKKNLLVLRLEFEYCQNHEALEAFQPPPNLKGLSIRGYDVKGGVLTTLNWIASLTKLRELNLFGWSGLKHLPPLGKLPSLESLRIAGLWDVKRIVESYDASSSSVIFFPKLQSLTFRGMDEWEEWGYETTGTSEGKVITIMPCLRSLKLYDCPKLNALPDHLLQLKTLETLEIVQCPILKKRYKVFNDSGINRIYRNPSFRDDSEPSTSSAVADF